MGIAAPPCQTTTTYVSQPTKSSAAISATAAARAATATSMSHSQGFHQGSSGVYGYSSDAFDRPDSSHHHHHHQDHQQQQHEQHEHVAQQSRRDKLRVQGFDPSAAAGHGLLPIDGDEHAGPGSMYEHAAAAAGASNMLSEMFNFPAPPSGPSATELLASQMSANYRFGLRQQQPGPGGVAGLSGDGGWFGAGAAGRAGLVLGGANMGSLGETSSPKQQQAGSMAGLATDPAAAMQLFLMNPQQQQSRSSTSPPPPTDVQHHEAFQAFGAAAAPFGGGATGVVEGQGLSLSLSPSLQQLEMAKQAEELRVRDGVLYFNRQQQQQGGPSVQQQQLPMALHGQVGALGQQLHVGYGPAGVAGVLRNSKYTRAAQELLEEFCSVGRGQIKGGARGGRGASASNPNNASNKGGASSSGAAQSPSSASKEPPQLSPADRFEHQRKKAKLISMLDEARPLSHHHPHTRTPSFPFLLLPL